MSKVHRRKSTLSHQHHPNPEMSFCQQPFGGEAPRQKTSTPNCQAAGEKDTDFLTKDFDFLSMNNESSPGNQSQASTKGPENNLYDQYEEKVRPCIDLIDSLRALGVERDLALPAIAVIGDQSSGKSSVLEALSGVSLPRGTGIITRCPLVLKLKKQPSELGWVGRISYQKTELELQDPSEVERQIRQAQVILAGNGTGISHEHISLEISSPEVPDLTLIDLPGIARVAMGNQPQDIGYKIKALIKSYIQRQQTINLVVVPCNVDIATTEALSMAQEVDPNGDRTIGVLTKPDLVDRGAEKSILDVVRNLTYPLKKGYMIVKCRGQKEVTDRLSLAEATKREMMFFQTHPYYRALLEEGKATVPRLAETLTAELVMHIKKSLPLLEDQIRECHQRAVEELRRCGAEVPSEKTNQLVFLIEKIKVFNQDIEKLVEGEEAVKENETRLYNKVREEFKSWVNVLAANTQKVKNIIHEEVTKYEKQYRGKELPGFISYKTFETIVHEYIQQLVDPAVDMLRRVDEIVHEAFMERARNNFSEFTNLHQRVQYHIDDIKMKQAEKAENMIQLQFKMEQLVFCQDQIYSVVLKKVREEILHPLGNLPQNIQFNPLASGGQCAISAITEIGVHLNAYFSETSKRLANQIPFIIQYFVLQENSDWLQKAIMQIIQEKNYYSWFLQEQSETAKKRRFLRDRVYRLTQARQALYKFSTTECQ
ncbi:PREDICTED: interferon-induced GTP-binding protein Mx2 [Propithecus coquereli]|uniref:Interferon-induced GTP-binding protein Mx2 n=1 Tax=Propithecus coquereli TaxID=379532 RepID=A0A2K6GIN6_PROCO|nr:PREDICTED: interferon-induced GTP-binding protein Mx2 [Propithecus coquereli]XP_012495523.1 PREDICTED: interferon-induced GTP-binding protein Mx2 [Propithecus coquereli]